MLVRKRLILLLVVLFFIFHCSDALSVDCNLVDWNDIKTLYCMKCNLII